MNLIKKGFLSDQMTQNADPFTMVTEHGEPLRRGDQEPNLESEFRLKHEKAFDANPGANTFCYTEISMTPTVKTSSFLALLVYKKTTSRYFPPRRP